MDYYTAVARYCDFVKELDCYYLLFPITKMMNTFLEVKEHVNIHLYIVKEINIDAYRISSKTWIAPMRVEKLVLP